MKTNKATKMARIIGLYLNPPENAFVLCNDVNKTISHNNVIAPLITALSTHPEEFYSNSTEKNNTAAFLAFIKTLTKKYKNHDLLIIVDDLSINKYIEVKPWLSQKENIKIQFTHNYSSWVNQMGLWLTMDSIENRIRSSKHQVVSNIMDYVKTYSSIRSKPFQWIYTGKTCNYN